MKALVTAENEWADADTTIEVVGFVERNYQTWAVWRDDYGMVNTVPTWAIRLLPFIGDAQAEEVA